MELLDKKQLNKKSGCCICGEESIIIDIVKTINPSSSEILNLRECSNCKHWWIDPIPNQKYLTQLYKDGSEFVVSKNYEGTSIKLTEEDFQKYLSEFFNLLSNDLSDLNYLEIGIGSGQLFSLFSRKVRLAYGVEPGDCSINHRNVVSDIDDVPKDIKFDIMVAQDVLEHLANLVDMLVKLRSFANGRAVIICGFPNSDSFKAKLLKGKWDMIRPIGHLHFFSSKSIEIMFEKSGWELIYKNKCSPGRVSTWGVIKQLNFNLRNPFKVMYNLIKILLLPLVLLLRKDQWYLIGKAKNKLSNNEKRKTT